MIENVLKAETLLIILVCFTFAHAWFFEKRMKVQDRQFHILLSRLNDLTQREPDDCTHHEELDPIG